MKTALVHDWLVTIAGAEKCLKIFHGLFPEAPLYTLVYNPESAQELGFDHNRVHASFLQRFPRAQKWYRKYLPLYPLAFEQFDLKDYDLILSSSHAAAKGVLTRAGQMHICYCHTPMRYAWDLTHEYLKDHGLDRGVKGTAARFFLHYLRQWDSLTANRVDFFIANSQYTARRIWRVYRRKADVIYPPVETNWPVCKKEDFFLFVSRLVPYKRADLVVTSFTELGLPLVVIGDGPQLKKCVQAAGENIRFLGYQENNIVKEMMSKARALVFAAEEDFGIVPVEAQACGTPVIAYGKGGVLETVVPACDNNWFQATGVFFREQSVSSLNEAIRSFLRIEDKFKLEALKNNADLFNSERFKTQINNFITEKYTGKKEEQDG
ncbi:MAG: Glycosyl transferase, group 1 [Desulfotomaculum sp. 46_296]|nr:MAG: Glycosyl transferase, group 1 [Desulfotomaculum sp. 46_296]HBY03646.1 glycosyl transferase [Desulfotomaculum sp.]